MFRYQILIEYVGTNFRGWQVQKKGKTIQGLLQEKISKLLKEKIILSRMFAILLGYFIWGEIPKVLTLLGAGLIIASSVIIFMRESQLKKQVISPRP